MARRGKNKAKCQLYRTMKKGIKNKLRKLSRHLNIHTNDKDASKAKDNTLKLMAA